MSNSKNKASLTDVQIRNGIDNAVSDREMVFYLLYSVFEKDGFSNLVIKSANNKVNLDFVSAMFYGTITMCYSIDFLVKQASKKSVEDMDPITRTIVRMGVWQIIFSEKVPEFAAVTTSVELSHKLKSNSHAYINAVLRRVCELDEDKKDINNYRPEIATSLTPEIFGVLKKSYGKDKALSIGKALLDKPVIAIRTNKLKANVDELKQKMIANGFVVRDSIIPGALIIEGGAIDTTEEFKNGWFFVQNEAAQLVGFIANPKEGDSVLDCCAAPGGKTTHISELTNDKAKVLALDINESRLELIKENTQRLCIKNVSVMQADSMNLGATLGDELYDLVLCDVPCSGLGLMSRKPDIRQTITYDRIEELLPKQREILQNSAKYVKKGGKLVFSTCTMNVKENEDNVRLFLENNKDFKPVDISSLVPSSLRVDDKRSEDMKSGYLTLFPDTDGFDGFFVCLMERI